LVCLKVKGFKGKRLKVEGFAWSRDLRLFILAKDGGEFGSLLIARCFDQERFIYHFLKNNAPDQAVDD